VMVFNRALYHNTAPDNAGGGTVDWTNRWNKYKYVDDIEAREDGGTPGFLQSIRAAMAIKLKEEMGCEKIHKREEEMLSKIFSEFRKIKGMNILAGNVEERIGSVSFYLDDIHFNLVVRLLNDRFGIQVRGGCSCAGTYGHYLLHVDFYTSNKITSKIDAGILEGKPGWIRMSIHPTMSDADVDYVIDAVKQVAKNGKKWGEDYDYDPRKNEFFHKKAKAKSQEDYNSWFDF